MTFGTRARSGASSIAWVMRVVRRAAHREVVLIVALQVLSALGVLAELALAREVLDRVIDDDAGARDLLPYVIPLAVAMAVVRLARIAEPDRSELAALAVDRTMTDEVLRVTSEVPLDEFERPEFHDEVHRVVEHALERPYELVHALFTLLSALLTTTAVVAAISAVDPVFLPVALLAYVPMWIALRRSNRELYDLAYSTTPDDRERYYLRDLLIDHRPAGEARGYGVGPTFRARHDELYARRLELQRRVARSRLRRALLSSALAAASAVGLISAILAATAGEGLRIADAVIAAVALQRLGTTLSAGYGALRILDAARPYLLDLRHLLDRVPSRTGDTPPPLPPLEELRVEGLRFRYPGTEVDLIDGLDLVIRPGTVLAITGSNGSGKTTLAKVLCGLYAPTGGRVLWNGEDVADLGRERLTASSSMLFQDFNRYRVSVRRNVGAGDVTREPADATIGPALEAASAREVVDRLPDGADTQLGVTFEGGTELSSGQWQRLALARALYRTDAQLLVLDEPTSALDATTERAVFDSLRSWAVGRAVVVISHRPLDADLADEVLHHRVHLPAHHVGGAAHHHRLGDDGQ